MMKRQNNSYHVPFSSDHMDELEWLQFRRQEVAKQLKEIRSHMQENYSALTQNEKIPSDKWGKTAYFLSKGGTILSGIKIGLKVGGAISTIIKLKKTFSKRR